MPGEPATRPHPALARAVDAQILGGRIVEPVGERGEQIAQQGSGRALGWFDAVH